jgi:hypothetical protein
MQVAFDVAAAIFRDLGARPRLTGAALEACLPRNQHCHAAAPAQVAGVVLHRKAHRSKEHQHGQLQANQTPKQGIPGQHGAKIRPLPKGTPRKAHSPVKRRPKVDTLNTRRVTLITNCHFGKNMERNLLERNKNQQKVCYIPFARPKKTLSNLW